VVFQDLIVNLINNIRGGHCSGSSRTRGNTGGKITKFSLWHPFFDGGIWWWISGWRGFPSASCLAKKINVVTAVVSIMLKLRALPDMLSSSLCYKKSLAIRHIKRQFHPATLSILSYDIEK
jgi:hypothetical protein